MLPLLVAVELQFSVLLLCGCAHQTMDMSRARHEFYTQTATAFSEGVLYKPSPATLGDLISKLAPLIIEEWAAPSSDGHRGPLGTGETNRLEVSHLTLYGMQQSVTIQGQPHAQLTFLWQLGFQGGRPGAPYCQGGVRITLDRAGAPAIWEALSDNAELNPIFVAQSLEKAAAAQFGPPLEGRHYSVEPPLAGHPNVVVAALLADGPLPMGPIVYLQARPSGIRTILCRCMPAQVRRIVASGFYDLRPVEVLLRDASPSAHSLMGFLTQIQGAGELNDHLRLPGSF